MHPDDAPRLPDGPPPAREQLPLPRRRRQAHLEPQLRTPGVTGAGTPFAPFSADDPAESARNAPADRAAAFHAGAHRGRGAGTTAPHRHGTRPHRADR